MIILVLIMLFSINVQAKPCEQSLKGKQLEKLTDLSKALNKLEANKPKVELSKP